MRPRLRKALFYVYCAIATLASAPFFARHIHYVFWPALVVVYFVALAIGGRIVLQQCARGGWAPIAGPLTLVALLGIADVYLYPKTLVKPSGGPIAMNLVTKKILHGRDPYNSVGTEPHNLSPGPGWAILNAPLVGLGKVELVTAFWLALASLALHRMQASSATAFVLLTLVQLDFLQMSFVGHDIFAICLAFVFVSVSAYLVVDRPSLLIPLAIIAGAAATARIPMIVALLPIAAGLYKSRRRAGILFGTVSAGSAVIIHGIFFAWATHDHQFYQPFHLFHRASTGAGLVFAGVGGLVALGLLALVVRYIEPHPGSSMIFNWLILSAAFVPIGIGELIHVDHFNWADWEGKNYVSFALALLVAALCISGDRADAI